MGSTRPDKVRSRDRGPSQGSLRIELDRHPKSPCETSGRENPGAERDV